MAIDGSMNIVQVQHLWWTTATFMGDCQNRQVISGFAKAITPKFSGSKNRLSLYQSIPEISCFGFVIIPSSSIS